MNWTNEQLFNRWIALKEDIQQLASIVQNNMSLGESDAEHWLIEIVKFKRKFDNLKDDTLNGRNFNYELDN